MTQATTRMIRIISKMILKNIAIFLSLEQRAKRKKKPRDRNQNKAKG